MEREAFKLFMLDTGLLCAKSNIDISMFYTGSSKTFSDFYGALTEQYVCQELKASYNSGLFYWGRDKGSAEVDFLVQYKNEVVPIEVKSAYNKQAQSLNVYIDLIKPKYAVKTSLNNYGVMGNLFSIPLYMISELENIISSN
jgi:predicted AAA+ superfamily ATPase